MLSAFDRYQVVALNADHGMKDLDDFILALIRDPRFPDRVNDIAVECGNSLYQPVLDRYIAGMEVPFTEVRKVWRNTTQSMMCSQSAFLRAVLPAGPRDQPATRTNGSVSSPAIRPSIGTGSRPPTMQADTSGATRRSPPS
ncbi:MAG: hypothetical protein WKG01_20740 [Kofleriaceae bacterium]